MLRCCCCYKPVVAALLLSATRAECCFVGGVAETIANNAENKCSKLKAYAVEMSGLLEIFNVHYSIGIVQVQKRGSSNAGY